MQKIRRTITLFALLLTCLGGRNMWAQSGKCGDPNVNGGENVSWSYGSGTLTISGSGAMADYPGTSAPWKSWNAEIITVVIEDGVTSIGQCAFDNCTALASVDIGADVASIGDEAFHTCSDLHSVTIPDNVTSIGNRAFLFCTALASVDFGSGLASIGDEAFGFCSVLASVTIPDNVTSIGGGAFENCDLLASVTIGSGVTSIGVNPFSFCDALATITVDAANENFTSTVNSVECNAIIEKSSNTLISGCKNTIIPDGVEAIGKHAFDGSKGLSAISIPGSVKSIGYEAFYICSDLHSVTIPGNVTRIGDDAFGYCNSLATVVCEATAPPSVGSDIFRGCSALTAIYVPGGSVDAYKSSWSAYADKIVAGSPCGANCYYTYDSGVKALSIFGSGAMAD